MSGKGNEKLKLIAYSIYDCSELVIASPMF